MTSEERAFISRSFKIAGIVKRLNLSGINVKFSFDNDDNFIITSVELGKVNMSRTYSKISAAEMNDLVEIEYYLNTIARLQNIKQ